MFSYVPGASKPVQVVSSALANGIDGIITASSNTADKALNASVFLFNISVIGKSILTNLFVFPMPKKINVNSVINMIVEYEGMKYDPNIGSNYIKFTFLIKFLGFF